MLYWMSVKKMGSIYFEIFHDYLLNQICNKD